MTINMKQSQAGAGLVEIMISLLIGLFLVAGVITIFTNNKRTYNYQQSQGTEAEYNRLAATVFGAILRQSGHTVMSVEALKGKKFVFTKNDKYQSDVFNSAGRIIFGVANDSPGFYDNNGDPYANAKADAIHYRFTGGDGVFGCDGYAVAATSQRFETLSVNSEGQLICEFSNDLGATTGSIVLIGDANVPVHQQLRVLSMEIQYGIDTNDNDSIDLYKRTIPDADVAQWLQVKSIVVNLTMQSGRRNSVKTQYVVDLPNMIGIII